MNVLVTGGSGFVGRAAVSELLRRGHRVLSTTRSVTKALAKHTRLSWIEWDAAKKSLPDTDWPHLDAVLHLAVPAGPFSFPEKNEVLFQLEVDSAFRLLEAARKHSVKRVLFASTGDVLGSESGPAAEDNGLYAPSSFYGTAKACMELLARAYEPVLCSMTLRFFHPYGPGGEKFLVNRLLEQVGQRREIRIEGKDGILLNPVWVEDLAEGVALALEKAQSGIFHFAGPETLTLCELINKMGRLLGVAPVMQSVAGECLQRHVGRFEKTAVLLGYSPRVTVQEGLERLLETAPYMKLKKIHKDKPVKI